MTDVLIGDEVSTGSGSDRVKILTSCRRDLVERRQIIALPMQLVSNINYMKMPLSNHASLAHTILDCVALGRVQQQRPSFQNLFVLSTPILIRRNVRRFVLIVKSINRAAIVTV